MRCAFCGRAGAHAVEYDFGDHADAVWLCDRCDADPDARDADSDATLAEACPPMPYGPPSSDPDDLRVGVHCGIEGHSRDVLVAETLARPTTQCLAFCRALRRCTGADQG